MEITENIFRLTVPFMDIYTSVFVIKTDNGALIFDTATYDADVTEYIIPFLNKIGVGDDELKYIFVSHNHQDHSGGAKKLKEFFPDAVIISGNKEICSQYNNSYIAKDAESILEVLKVVSIPGHTADSCAIFDTRNKVLLSGDCLQMHGIYGCGKWGSNIPFPDEHIKAIEKLREMDIDQIITAHDYHPYGYIHKGREQIKRALDACVQPIYDIKSAVDSHPELNDEGVCELYNASGLPVVGVHVITAIRNANIKPKE